MVNLTTKPIFPQFFGTEDNYTDKEACKFEENIHFLNFSLSHQKGSGEFKILGKIHIAAWNHQINK
jgi:hypothetical protein